MSSFAESGFLSTQMNEHVDATRIRYKEWVDLIRSINEFGQGLQYKIKVDPNEPQNLVCATLYARALSTFQAAVLISERGMIPQTRMLLRCMLESVFSLVAISKDKELAKQFIAADFKNRLRLWKKAEAWEDESLRDLARQRSTGVTRESIEKDAKEVDAKEIPAEQMAMKAGLHDWYLTAYPILSGSVHTTIRDLESHLVVDDTNNIVGIVNEPSMEGVDILFLTAAEAMLRVFQAIERVFGAATGQFVGHEYAELGRLRETIASGGRGKAKLAPGSHGDIVESP